MLTGLRVESWPCVESAGGEHELRFTTLATTGLLTVDESELTFRSCSDSPASPSSGCACSALSWPLKVLLVMGWPGMGCNSGCFARSAAQARVLISFSELSWLWFSFSTAGGSETGTPASGLADACGWSKNATWCNEWEVLKMPERRVPCPGSRNPRECVCGCRCCCRSSELLCRKRGVPMGVLVRLLSLAPIGLYPGHMMLMREGEGEGVREESALPGREAPDRSQFWRRSRSSSWVGPSMLFPALAQGQQRWINNRRRHYQQNGAHVSPYACEIAPVQ